MVSAWSPLLEKISTSLCGGPHLYPGAIEFHGDMVDGDGGIQFGKDRSLQVNMDRSDLLRSIFEMGPLDEWLGSSTCGTRGLSIRRLTSFL
jgi:hypothetical protein